MSPNSQTHHDHWQRACKKLKEAEQLLVSADGAKREMLLDAIERWEKIRDWHALDLMLASARESIDEWEAIVGVDEPESE